jgi:hypothetical protein
MAEKLSQKLAKQENASPAPEQSNGDNSRGLSEEKAAKIADYRARHPTHVQFLKDQSRERLENIATLRDIERAEQRERIHNATGQKLEKWLETRPEVAKRIAETVAKLPQADQAGARYRMIDSAVRNEGLRNVQGTGGPRV